MISNLLYQTQYTGNGVTVAFATPVFFDNTHLYVVLYDTVTGASTVQALTTNYTLAGLGGSSGGTLTMLVAPTSTEQLTITRVVPFLQATDYVNNDSFDADAHERQMDLIVQMVQQLARGDTVTLRTFEFPVTESEDSDLSLPGAVGRSSRFIYFDSDGNLQVVTPAQVLSILGLSDEELAFSTLYEPIAVSVDTNLTAALANDKLVQLTGSTGRTFTVLQDSDDTDINIGDKWDVMMEGTGAITFAAGAGATLLSAEGVTPRITTQYGAATVVKVAANSYRVFGRMVT